MSFPPNPLMQQAQQQMQNPMGQAVPQGGSPIEGIANHPLIQQLLKGLGTIAQSYGYTAMSPGERLQRTELDQQKAEAMGRLGMQGQQLGLEGQRVGIEQQRANTENTLGTARNALEAKRIQQEGSYQTGTLANEQNRTKIDQQRADTEKAQKQQELDRQEKQFQSEYGPRGLRSQELGVQQGRLKAEQQMNGIIAQRDAAERDYHNASLKAQGLQTDRTALEDERKARYKVVDDTLDKHFWFFNTTKGLLDAKNAKHAEIDADINGRMAQAEKAAGTGAGAGQGGAQVIHYDNQGNRIQGKP